MIKVYINGVGSVSTQARGRGFLENNLIKQEKAVNEAIQPSYKEMIAPAVIRRMAKGVKMGIYASQMALDEANIAVPEAVIAGTGMGCLIDSAKFLKNMIDNEENYLTPTSFVQSTYNTVAAQIALRLQCKGYNSTYVNRRVSFESALMDALLQLEQEELNNALVGGVDEIEAYSTSLLRLIKKVNIDDQTPFPKGTNIGEGATFFTLSTTKTEQSYAQLRDVSIQNEFSLEQLIPFTTEFLTHNALQPSDIDLLLLGTNNTGNDLGYYDVISTFFPAASVVHYKDFVGEYDTASAFGFLLANEILKTQCLSAQLVQRPSEKKRYRNVLLYNQFDGVDHSLILLSRC